MPEASPVPVQHDGSTRDEVTEQCLPQNTAEQDYDRGIIVNAQDMTAEMFAAASKRKERKSKSTKSKKAYKHGKDKPTGFEDNFADAPMTPEQYAEIQEFYHKDLPFVDRILRAIQRFERTRKMCSERRDIFYKYLAYGGIDVGPNMFQGYVQTEEMDKDDITTNMAQTNISTKQRADIFDPKMDLGTNHGQPSVHHKYIVDFQTTMRAFLSRRAPDVVDMATQLNIDMVTTTLERFMDYLLRNEVCQEYNTEVLETRNLCRQARDELWTCVRACKGLPGDFNVACSTLIDGRDGELHDGQIPWRGGQPRNTVFGDLTAEKAMQLVGFAIASVADDVVYQRYAQAVEAGHKLEVVNTIRGHGLEIIEIERATNPTKEMYRANTDELRPVGIVEAKFWRNPQAPPEDLTEHERRALVSGSISLDAILLSSTEGVTGDDHFKFFLEDSTILPHLQVGQRIECTIHKLDVGIWFLDEVVRIYPSFDVWIENELTYDWKDVILPDKYPASIEDNGDQKDAESSSLAIDKEEMRKETILEESPAVAEPTDQDQYTGDEDRYPY